MTEALKIGDRLLCVTPHRDWLRKDQVYTVAEVERSFAGDGDEVLVVLKGVPPFLWGPWRFTAAPSEEPQ